MGVSFSAGTSPTVGKPSFELAADEMELGLGIHGEPGVTRTHLQSADQLTETLLTQILKQGKFGNGRRVVTMINNLGATTEMELAMSRAMRWLSRATRIYRGADLCGDFFVIPRYGGHLHFSSRPPGWLAVPARRTDFRFSVAKRFETALGKPGSRSRADC